jgi:hypothetical protein
MHVSDLSPLSDLIISLLTTRNMKKQLLALAMCAMVPFCSQAQNSELGLAGGIGLHSAPGGDIHYKADQGGSSPLICLTYVSNRNRYSESKLTWQIGFDAFAVMSVKNKSNDTFSYFAQTIGNDGKDFRYANYLLSFSPLVNLKYKLSDVTYVYGGLSAGAAGTRNVSNVKPQDFVGTDVTYKAPDGGIGFCGAIQAGIVQRITQRIAVNAQVGFRYYSLTYKANDINYPGGNVFSYNTTMIPVIVGIRYRMGWLKEYNSATGRYELVKEEIKSKKEKEE